MWKGKANAISKCTVPGILISFVIFLLSNVLLLCVAPPLLPLPLLLLDPLWVANLHGSVSLYFSWCLLMSRENSISWTNKQFSEPVRDQLLTPDAARCELWRLPVTRRWTTTIRRRRRWAKFQFEENKSNQKSKKIIVNPLHPFVLCMVFLSNTKFGPLLDLVGFLGCAGFGCRPCFVVSRSQIVRGGASNNECEDTPGVHHHHQQQHQNQTANSGSGVGLQQFNGSSNTSSYKASKSLRMPSAPINSAEQARLLG